MDAEPLSLQEEMAVRLRCAVVNDPADIFNAERRLLATLDAARAGPLDAASTDLMTDLLDELRRLNDGLAYDRAIEAWKRGEGRHPDD